MEGLDNHKIFVPPKTIILKNYTYKFKEELVNKNFTYRCQNRSVCGLVIHISKENLEKLSKENTDKIPYVIVGKLKEHQCVKKNEDDTIKKEPICNKSNINNIKILIMNSLEKTKGRK